jgi:hypothetical protein
LLTVLETDLMSADEGRAMKIEEAGCDAPNGGVRRVEVGGSGQLLCRALGIATPASKELDLVVRESGGCS